MKFTSNFHEVKTVARNKKLIEGEFISDELGSIKATIWREDKDGKVFPNFDSLAPGHEFEAEPWKHPTKGTYTLYPPKVASTGQTGGNKGAGIAKLMDKKAVAIEKSQDRKEESITKASCQRDAVLITTTFYADQLFDDKQIAEKIEYWRKYLQNQLEKTPF